MLEARKNRLQSLEPKKKNINTDKNKRKGLPFFHNVKRRKIPTKKQIIDDPEKSQNNNTTSEAVFHNIKPRKLLKASEASSKSKNLTVLRPITNPGRGDCLPYALCDALQLNHALILQVKKEICKAVIDMNKLQNCKQNTENQQEKIKETFESFFSNNFKSFQDLLHFCIDDYLKDPNIKDANFKMGLVELQNAFRNGTYQSWEDIHSWPEILELFLSKFTIVYQDILDDHNLSSLSSHDDYYNYASKSGIYLNSYEIVPFLAQRGFFQKKAILASEFGDMTGTVIVYEHIQKACCIYLHNDGNYLTPNSGVTGNHWEALEKMS